jgi:hypothetical protein
VAYAWARARFRHRSGVLLLFSCPSTWLLRIFLLCRS